ncbi:uncharacterized protein G2W53_033471 [Senna tora]|uniref:Uncharacterized protein n=1 Tax=Senna tora TaxID=362788 RepID=A0A834W707_9FABA|nr:uncharacterized protein G2W53_033471 [Senna tora]
MSSFRVDRIWMYNQLVPSRKGLTEEFVKDDLKVHLYKYGFVPNYYQWISHGEPFVPIICQRSRNNQGNQANVPSTPINPYRTMVLEATGASMDFEFDRISSV